MASKDQYSLELPGDKQPAPPPPKYELPKKTWLQKAAYRSVEIWEQWSHRGFRKLWIWIGYVLAGKAAIALTAAYMPPIPFYKTWKSQAVEEAPPPAPAELPKFQAPNIGPWESITRDAEGRPR